jgi:hypothetical protein
MAHQRACSPPEGVVCARQHAQGTHRHAKRQIDYIVTGRRPLGNPARSNPPLPEDLWEACAVMGS